MYQTTYLIVTHPRLEYAIQFNGGTSQSEIKNFFKKHGIEGKFFESSKVAATEDAGFTVGTKVGYGMEIEWTGENLLRQL